MLSYANFRKNASINEQGEIIETFKNDFDVVTTRTVSVETLESDLQEYRKREQEKTNKSLESLHDYSMESVERVKAYLSDSESQELLTLLQVKTSDVILTSQQRKRLSTLKHKLQRALVQAYSDERQAKRETRTQVKAINKLAREQKRTKKLESIKLSKIEREKRVQENVNKAKQGLYNRLETLSKKSDAYNVPIQLIVS